MVDVDRRAVLALPLVIGGAVALKPENPVVGGTVLRRAAIQSPNFVTGVSGWTINQDGSAEFNNLTLRGVFKGTNYVINASGAFFYSAAPAAGNLVESVTSAAGTDAFGNVYLAGYTVYSNSGGVPLSAMNTVASALRFYTWSGSAWVIGPQLQGPQVGTNSFTVVEQSGLSGFPVITSTDTTTPAAVNNTVAAAITAAYTISAKDSQAGTVYEIEVPFTGTTEGQTVQWGVLLDSTTRAGTTIGPAFFGLGTAVDGDIKAQMLVRTAGAAGQVDFSVKGGVGLSGTRSSGTNNNDAYLSAVQANVAHDTTVSHTLAVYAVFGAAAAGQVITGHGSVFTRKGP